MSSKAVRLICRFWTLLFFVLLEFTYNNKIHLWLLDKMLESVFCFNFCLLVSEERFHIVLHPDTCFQVIFWRFLFLSELWHINEVKACDYWLGVIISGLWEDSVLWCPKFLIWALASLSCLWSWCEQGIAIVHLGQIAAVFWELIYTVVGN